MKKLSIISILILICILTGASFAEGTYHSMLTEPYGIYDSELMTITYDPQMITIHNKFLEETTYVQIMGVTETSDLGMKIKANVTTGKGEFHENLEGFIVSPYSDAVTERAIELRVTYPMGDGTNEQVYRVLEAKMTEAPYVNVYWNMQKHDFAGQYKFDFDVMPQTVNGRTMVPLRAIFEALGYEVTWEASTQTATCDNGFNVMTVAIGNENIILSDSDESVTIVSDTPPLILNGRTMVPLRVISEASGLEVVWDGTNRTAHLIGDRPTTTLDLSRFEEIEIEEENEIALKVLKSDLAGANTKELYPFKVEDNNKFYVGYMDEHGNVEIEPKYTTGPEFVNGFATPEKDFGEGGAIINEDGKEIRKGPYVFSPISESAFKVYLIDENLYTHVDTKGERLYSQYYDLVSDFNGQLAKVTMNGSDFVIDKKGKEYLKNGLFEIVETSKEDYLVIATDKLNQYNGPTGVVDLNGKPFIPMMFTSVIDLEIDGFRGVYEDAYYFFDMNGEAFLEDYDTSLVYEDEELLITKEMSDGDLETMTVTNKITKASKAFTGFNTAFYEVVDDRIYILHEYINDRDKTISDLMAIELDSLKVKYAEDNYISYMKNGYFEVEMEDKHYYGIGYIDSDVIKPDMSTYNFEYIKDEDE